MEPIMLKPETPAQFLSQIDDICSKESHVFRGENCAYEYVSSSIFRKYRNIFDNSDDFIPLDVEREVVERARVLQFSRNTTVPEILTDIRHFGGDTTLIDFTRSLPVALFFGSNGRFDENGRIIAVPTKRIPNAFNDERYGSRQTIQENMKMEKEEIKEDQRKELRDSEKNLSFLNPYKTLNSRARVEFQSSIFIHAPRGYIDEAESGYISIVIPKELKLACLEHLDRSHNIRHDTIYNDLIGYIENERNWEKGAKWLYSGLSRMQSKKYEKAVNCFDKSIKHNPKIAKVWAIRARANLLLEKYDEANDDLARFDEFSYSFRK